VILARKIEMWNAVDATALVAIHRNVKRLRADVLGRCDILRYETLVNFLLPDLSDKLLYHVKHRSIDCVRHALKRVHAIDVLLHAAVTKCAPDRLLSIGMRAADKRGRYTSSVVPVAARAPVGPVL